MPEDTTGQMNDKLNKIQEGIFAVQALVDRNNDRIDALDKDQIKKISDDVATAIQERNDMKAKVTLLEEKQVDAKKTVVILEKLICRLPKGGDTKKQEDLEAKNEFIAYMRKKTPMSDAVVLRTCTDMINKSFFGVTDAEKQCYIKVMQEGVNPDGGYWVRPELSATIVTRNFETSPMRQIASVETIGTEELELVIDDDEAEAEWVGEVTARAETDTPQIGILKIFAHELSAKPKVTQRMLDDAGFDLESWLAKKVADKFSRKENTSFVVGNGSLKPKGILSYDAWASAGTYERNKIEQINSGAAATFTGDGIIKLQNSLQDIYQAGSTFLTKRASWESIMILKDGNGRYLLLQNGDLRSAPDKLLLGAPVMFMQDMQAVGADALAMAYGNFKIGYTIVDRIGIRVLRDPFTAKPYVLFYTTKRTGGAVTNFESYKIQKLAV